MNKVSMTQQFIDNYINQSYDDRIVEITKEQFEKRIVDEEAKVQFAYKKLDMADYELHPMQKIYVVCDYVNSYESGMTEWGFEFLFKYKGKYYSFMNYGGN